MRDFNKPDKINPEAHKLPKENRAERGIICFLYHNPDMLEKIKQRLSGGFVTEFNKRVYDFLAGLIESGSVPDISRFNEEFKPAEVGRITEIVSDETFANDKDALLDYISVLNNYKTENEKPVEMNDEELREWVRKQKENKK